MADIYDLIAREKLGDQAQRELDPTAPYQPAASTPFAYAPTPFAPRLVGPKEAPVAPEDDVYSKVAETMLRDAEATRQQRLKAATEQNPDQAAEASRFAERYKVPFDVAYRNLPELKKREAAEQAGNVLADAPKLRAFLDANPDMLPQVQDEIAPMAELERTIVGTLGDVGVTALKGAVGLGSAVVGLANLPTGGYVGLGLERAAGVRFEETQKFLDSLYSAPQQRANAAVAEAEGFIETIGAMLSNPSTIATFVGESVPQMFGGAAAGRLLVAAAPRVAPWLAAAFGEGLMASGSSAENLRGEDEEGTLGWRQTLASLGTGVGTALFGAAGGKLAQKFKIADVDTALVAGGLDAAKAAAVRRGFVGSLARAGVTEGVFEEFPQSVQEQMWQNFATERPLGEGVGKAAAQGLLVGMAAGGGFQAIGAGAQRATQALEDRQRMAANEQRLAQMMQQAGALASRERNPEGFRQAMQALATQPDGTEQMVFVDGGVLSQLPLEIIQQLPEEVWNQITPAAESGDRVAIPVSAALAYAPGTPLEQAIQEHGVLNPFDDSPAELAAQDEQAQEFAQQEQERIVAQAENQENAQAEADLVRETLAAEITAAGRYRPKVADAMATWASSFYTAMGARTGMTPVQFMQRYRLRVLGTAPAVQGQVLNAVPATQEDFTREALPTLLDRADWAVLTAEDPGAQKASPEQNAQRMAELQADLDALGVRYQPAVGKYGDVQNSLIVTGLDEARATELGKKYGQESVLTRRGLVYMDGRLVPATGVEVFDTPPDDFYTEVPGTGAYFSVALNFDDDTNVDSDTLSQRAEGDTRFRETAQRLLDANKPPARSAVGIMRGEVKTPTFRNIFEISQWFTQRNRRGMEDMTNPAVRKRLLDSLYADVLMALTDPGSAIGWYDTKVKAALDLMAQVHPEIATDPAARFGFVTILAITSNQTKVNENFELANALYTAWKKTNVFPVDVAAVMDTRAKTEMSKSLAKMRDLIAEHGVDKLREFMTTKRSAREIEAFTGYTLAGELKDSEVYGATFLGSKIGAFFNNLYGNFDTVTMDRWFMRSINRTRGTMLELPGSFADMLTVLENQLLGQGETATGVVDSETFGATQEDLLAEIAAYRALTPEQQKDILVVLPLVRKIGEYAKARHAVYSRGREIDGKQRSYVDRTPENLLAKNIDLALHGDAQTPRDGSDRAMLRDLVLKLQKRLKAEGIDMVVADIQAALWYYEKDLFDKLKGSVAQADMFGETKEAEDYETAARRVVATVRGDTGRSTERDAGARRPAAGRRAAQRVPARQFAADTGDLFAQRAAPATESVEQPKVGIHFSQSERTTLDGRYWGTGLKGAERERLSDPGVDPRLRERVAVYIDTGNGIRPESGVGGYAHEIALPKLYDAKRDPLKLSGGGANAFETRVLDAGFDGYWVPNFTTEQGAAVILGPASRGLKAKPVAAPERPTKAPIRPQDLEWQDYAVDATSEAAAARAGRMVASGKWNDYDIEVNGTAVRYRRKAQEPLAQGPRGTFNPRTLEVVLNPNANLTTWFHETGHFFLEVMADIASQPNAPAQIAGDMAAVLKWFGVADLATWNAMTLDQQRQYHERWAESIEQYIMEGKAPSKELAPLLRKFSAWLKDVYKSIQAMLKLRGAEGSPIQLNDDIRRIMDRMLATDEQIAEAEQIAGLTPDEESTDAAAERLRRRSMGDLKWAVRARDAVIKKLQAQAKALRKEAIEQATQDVDAMPEMRAARALEALTVDVEHQGRLEAWNKERSATEAKAKEEVQAQYLAAEEAKTGVELKGLDKGQFLSRVRREVAAQVELQMVKWERANRKPLRQANPNDAEMATIADSFGFPSVEAMVQAIEDFGTRRDAIDTLAEQRMLEEHGDLVDDRAIQQAANEAVHNEARARSLATELRTQAEMLNERQDTGRVSTKGSRITTSVLLGAAKAFAANIVARTPLRSITATGWSHTAAERRAARRWAQATAKGDTEEAVKAKQDQLLHHAAAAALLDAQAEGKKIRTFFARVVKGKDEKVVEKGRDPDIVNAARAVLAAYGIETPASKGAQAYLKALQEHDPETHNVIAPMIAAAVENAQPIDALTFAELENLHEAIQAMWHLARQSRQMEVAGNLMDIDDAAQEIYLKLEEIGIPANAPGEAGALTKKEERGRMLQYAGALLRRVEQWAEAKDGKYGGPFLRIIFQPVKDAATRYRHERLVYRRKFKALVDKVAPSFKPGEIAAPELGYTFGRGHNGGGYAELLHALLHTGNASNKRKLLLGRKWATENPDGTLDTTKWDTFIARLHRDGVLRREHYNFVQGVWDLLEETKAGAQKAHRDVYGRYFAEVTADSFDTPFGTFRGGYVPAQADARLVPEADQRELIEAENANMAFAFPGTAKGFTQSRVEYNRPLVLDLRTLPQHIDKVLLFTHMEVPVRAAARLLRRPKVQQPLNLVDPAAISGMLRPWLNRSARQLVETPIVGDGRISRILSVVRARAGMALMFGNVSNALQQFTGFSNLLAKVQPGLVMKAMAQYLKHPRQFVAGVHGMSNYMAERGSQEVAAMNGQIEELLLDPTLLERAQDWAMRHAYFMQVAMDNVLSPIAWTGAYNQALAQGLSPEDAVRYSDGIVRQTQTSTLPEDISRIESGPAYARVFTQFFNYFSMLYNTNTTAVQQVVRESGVRRGAGRIAYITMLGLLVPLWTAEAIAVAMRGGPEDDDDDGYLDDWITAVIGMGTVKGLLASVPIVGQFAVAGVNRVNNNPADDRVSLAPVVSLAEAGVGAPVSVYKALMDEGSARKATRDLASLLSLLTGLPFIALARPAGYAAGMVTGEIEPTSQADAVRGLVTGAASPESR